MVTKAQVQDLRRICDQVESGEACQVDMGNPIYVSVAIDVLRELLDKYEEAGGDKERNGVFA